MSKIQHIKCYKCGTFNENSDYCLQCGVLINPFLRRKADIEKRLKIRNYFDKNAPSLENSINKLLYHQNWFIKWISRFFYPIWLIIMGVGAFIAWVFATIAA